MKKENSKNKFNVLFIVIPVLLCAVVVSLTIFLPKLKASSDNGDASSNKTSKPVSQTDTNSSSQNTSVTDTPSHPDTTEKNVIYQLIYADDFISCFEDGQIPSIKDDLIDGYLKEILSRFEGQDVYFRVWARPVGVIEEISNYNDYTPEKRDEIIKQRMEYIKEVGAMDIATSLDYTYNITVNAEMIKKIGEKGGCYLYLAEIAPKFKYQLGVKNDEIKDNIITVNVTEDMKIS